MSKNLQGITDGTYTLMETRQENQFYFFRNDEGVLENVGSLPLEFYHNYIRPKVVSGEVKEGSKFSGTLDMRSDSKFIRMTIYMMEEDESVGDDSTYFVELINS